MQNLRPIHRGLDVILSVNNKKLGGQHNAILTRKMSPIKVTNKINGEWEQSLSGVKSWTLTCNGFIIKDEESFQELEECFSAGTPVTVSLNDNKVAYTGTALITNFPVSAPYDEQFSYSIVLLGIDELTFAVADQGQ